MKLEEIAKICRKYPELREALADAFGHKISLGKLSQKPDGIIDSHLLCATLEEYREISGTNSRFDTEEKVEKRIPFLFVVWKDNSVVRSNDIAYRCVGTTHDDWTGNLVHSGEMGWDDDVIKPIAQLFVDRSDVHYVIKLEKISHRWVGEQERIDSLSIQLFFPEINRDIQSNAQAIMESWEEYGHTDYFEDEHNDE